MLKRRVPRVLTAGFLLTIAVAGLSACRSDPSVAAYVGDDRITVAELESAVAERREDPEIDAFAEANPADFTRRVLTLLVQEEVFSVAAERYGVSVGNGEVRDRLDQLLAEVDPEAAYGGLAAQGIGRTDVFENVRQLLIRQRIAVEEGAAPGLTEEGLRAAYEQTRESMAQVQLGYISVPDQTVADSVLAELTANPASYPAVAARFPGPYTLPELQQRAPEDVPTPLAEQVAAAQPDTGFTVAVEEVGGVIVGFVGGVVYPTFEELRPQLEQQAVEQASQAGDALVEELRADLDITFNPRFGEFEDGQLAPGGSDVVTLLEEEGAGAGEPAAAN